MSGNKDVIHHVYVFNDLATRAHTKMRRGEGSDGTCEGKRGGASIMTAVRRRAHAQMLPVDITSPQ